MDRIRWNHYFGVFTLSFATLLLELALTRVLSVTLWYHFGFLVITTALLGFAAAGSVLAASVWLRQRAPLDQTLTGIGLLFGVSAVGGFWALQQIPFDPLSVFSDHRQWIAMPTYYVVAALPFFCSGLALALLFSRAGFGVGWIYAADLLGAGVGCTALAVAMPLFGGAGTVVLAGAAGITAAAVFAVRRSRLAAVAVLALAAGTGILAREADRALPIRVTASKPRPPGRPIFTAWNTFSRIDLHVRPAEPDTLDRASLEFVFDAGTASTRMLDLRPDVQRALLDIGQTRFFESNIAYVLKFRPSILVIGAGAGEEVLDGVHGAARTITAVEINPIITSFIRANISPFWGELFQQPGVDLLTEDGRSFVRRTTEQYDAIIAARTVSNAAVSSGALSLAENYLLTREAFLDYIDHLAADGVLFVTRPESQMPRLVATGRAALAARGVPNSADHVYIYRHPPSDGSHSGLAGFLLKKTPFTRNELRLMNEHLGVGDPTFARRIPGGGPIELLYSSLAPHRGSIYQRLLTVPPDDLPELYRSQPTQVEPSTDDRPFFNHQTRWSTLGWSTVRDLLSQNGPPRIGVEEGPITEVTLLALLAQVAVIAGLGIVAPIALARRTAPQPDHRRILVFFGAIGLGYIMTEMALVQRFTLVLGQPIYTLAMVLSSLLIFTGIGAAIAARLELESREALQIEIPLVLVVLILTAFIAPSVFSFVLRLTIGSRLALSIAAVAPIGIVMGLPFATGLRMVARQQPSLVPWAWAVNGFCTVVGTVIAVMLAMTLGLTVVLIAAALCYSAALAAALSGQATAVEPT